MKEITFVLTIVAMAIIQLVLAGMNLILGVLLMSSTLLIAILHDKMKAKNPQRTTTITEAARQCRTQQQTVKGVPFNAAAA